MRIYVRDDLLIALHARSDGQHTLVDNPNEADIVMLLVGNDVVESELVGMFGAKAFAISTTDLPQYTSHGVYTTVEGGLARFGRRVKSGAYNMISDAFKNPYVKEAAVGAGLDREKDFLFSFIGRQCHPSRDRILSAQFQRPDVLVQDSSHFDLWEKRGFADHRDEMARHFYDSLVRSKFGLCPRGVSINSIRLFECLKLGVAPVIIADGWLPPIGPNWEEFAIFVPESDLGRLEEIVAAREGDWRAMGEKAATAHAQYFSDEAYFNFLVANCALIQKQQWLPESLCSAGVRAWLKGRQNLRDLRKKLGLGARLRRLRGG